MKLRVNKRNKIKYNEQGVHKTLLTLVKLSTNKFDLKLSSGSVFYTELDDTSTGIITIENEELDLIESMYGTKCLSFVRITRDSKCKKSSQYLKMVENRVKIYLGEL